MKPEELVSRKRQEQISRRWKSRRDIRTELHRQDYLDGFRAALKELGIAEVRYEVFIPGGAVLVCFDKIHLRDGAVLVREKK